MREPRCNHAGDRALQRHTPTKAGASGAARRTKLPRHFTAHKLDKHRRLLAELPSRVEERQQSIHGRNQLLAATQAYNLALEKRRVTAHITEMPGTIQRQIAHVVLRDLP